MLLAHQAERPKSWIQNWGGWVLGRLLVLMALPITGANTAQPCLLSAQPSIWPPWEASLLSRESCSLGGSSCG